MVANIQTMAYVGEVPWHGKGKKLAAPATAEEMLTEAGMDWKVRLAPLYLSDRRKVDHRAVIREDTNEILSIVGPGFVPLQNREAFAVMDDTVGRGLIRYETAGVLGQGEKVWALAQLPGEVRIEGTEDITKKYLAFANGHNGMLAFRMFYTPVRIVCQNTLSAALSGAAGQGVYLKHTANIANRAQYAQEVLGFAVRWYDEFNVIANKLVVAAKPSLETVRQYVASIFTIPQGKKEIPESVVSARATVEDLYQNGESNNLPGIEQTWWGAYNAVTDFIDHRPRKSKDGDKARDTRLGSIWFGQDASTKRRALDLAIAMSNT